MSTHEGGAPDIEGHRSKIQVGCVAHAVDLAPSQCACGFVPIAELCQGDGLIDSGKTNEILHSLIIISVVFTYNLVIETKDAAVRPIEVCSVDLCHRDRLLKPRVSTASKPRLDLPKRVNRASVRCVC